MPSILGRFTKQPDEALDYTVDFSDWFSTRGDAPSSYVVVVEDGLTLDGDSRAGEVVTVVLSGGTSGASYKVTVRLTTDAATPITKEADFIVKVKAV